MARKRICPALVAAAAFAFLVSAVLPVAVQARNPRKVHVVKEGESIAEIADFYGVSQRDLLEINKLRQGESLKVGRELKIPNVLRVQGSSHKVKNGDTLVSIAEQFGRKPKEIARANKLKLGSKLKVGSTLVIPDGRHQGKSIDAKERQIKPIDFLRVRTGDRKRLELYRKNGEVNKQAVGQLSFLARDKEGGKVKRLNYRLVEMIQFVSEQFPDKAIEIISGYRAEASGEESQHQFGRALDFRISGVPLRQIHQFCKSMPRTGCGLYSDSGFVHMDAREKSASW